MKELRIVIPGAPRTKKNSQRIIVASGRPRIIPSKDYEVYELAALWRLPRLPAPIDEPVCVCVAYFMPTRRRVDLVNLLEATLDLLVKGRVLADDNSRIVVSHDGSRVLYDKADPRAEITISSVKTENEEAITK